MPESVNTVPPELLPLIPALLLGIGLAASSGLRTFLPLLMLAFAAKFNFFGMALAESFSWLSSDLALYSLGAATVIEILGDKIPVVDHALDVVGTFSRPIAGALGAAAVLNISDPSTAAMVGIIVGAPLSFGVHAVKAGTRGASTVTTAGMGNPLLSLGEDIMALFIGALSIALPLLVPVILVIAVYLLWKIYRGTRGLLRRTA